MKRHLFWRLIQTHRKRNATLLQILAAVTNLGLRYFSRLNRRAVRRAHVAIHGAVLALVETGNVTGENLVHPHRYA